MAWVPFVVASRRNRYRRSRSGGAIIAGVILLFVFGVLAFFFFNRFNGSTIVLWPIISGLGGFIIFIAVIGAIAASMSGPSKRPNEEYIKSYQHQPQEPSQQLNPYRIQNSIQKQPEEPIYKEIEREIPVVSDINYCKYCGSKIDGYAVFCHQCGTKM